MVDACASLTLYSSSVQRIDAHQCQPRLKLQVVTSQLDWLKSLPREWNVRENETGTARDR